MAGLAVISMQQRVDRNGRPYDSAKAYFYEAATLAPIVVYQDYGLGTAHPNPVLASATGVFPPIFIDEEEGFYRMRVTTADGVVIDDLATLPVIGPSGGSGGSEVPVDANALFKTGDAMWLDVTGTRAGWVRDNGRTIGSATSGASERANSDCEALYAFYWQNFSDTLCPVTGGRGASAAADWAANKPIATRDRRGKTAVGLDDMGNTAAGRITAGTPTAAGSGGGEEKHALTSAENGPHTHTAEPHSHQMHATDQLIQAVQAGGALRGFQSSVPFDSDGSSNAMGSTDNTTITINTSGSGTAHNNMQPYDLGSWYRKL